MANSTTKSRGSKNGGAAKKSALKNPEDGKKYKPSGESDSQLQKLFHDQIKDIYWAEKHLTKALPKMHAAATSKHLKDAIDNHLAQTEEHVARLEKVFEILEKLPQGKKCDGMEGLVNEGENAIEETEDGSMIRDVAIIMSAQKVEHYEISTYGTLIQLADTIGNSAIAELLEATLEEEKQADQILSDLAKNNINWNAKEEKE